VNYWSNVLVRLNDVWGHSLDGLTTPTARLPEFIVHPRHLRDAAGKTQLAHFTIDFPSGYLDDGWQGVNFVPMGSQAVSGISGLPPWDPSQKNTYQRMISSAVSLGDSRTLRLEAIIPYLGQKGGVGYKNVRLFYVPNAVNGPVPDLVIVQTHTLIGISGTVQARQDGSGQGPPGKPN
jgi:hypothetical protein